MPILHAIILGVSQGLSEYLPISSSGHLRLVPWFFGWDDFAGQPGLEQAFDVALHIGTLVGALAYFRKDIFALVRDGLGGLLPGRDFGSHGRLAWLLLLSAVPGAVVGAALNNAIEKQAEIEWMIGVMLILGAGLLLWADRRGGTQTIEAYGTKRSLAMGVGQALALQPGVSRSGVTITVGRALGFRRDVAVRIAFLMSIPITGGAVLYEAVDLFSGEGISEGFMPAFIWGIVASAITGWFAIWGTLKWIRTRTFTPFVVYRLALGVVVIGLAVSGFGD